ncbi:Uncharacterised protein [Escherichia coli]|uniref:Uncharacterized protein n=1 Tax=Escherichia coli TaxID=562 RepID=A0A376MGQ1_ECOLX|nr:Uncharacterised protein [Escherichia coli]
MHIISKAPFEECARKYPNDALALHSLYRVIKGNGFFYARRNANGVSQPRQF